MRGGMPLGSAAPRARGARRRSTAGDRAAVLTALAVAVAGCASTTRTETGGPAPPGVLRSSLPPIPPVTGPLRLAVAYPDSLQRITATDSNFVFGSVGTGDATLIIDGAFIPVEPNGAFLAWLPVPEPASGDTAWYRLVARRGTEADTLSHPVLLPPAPWEGTPGTVWIDSASLAVPAERWALPEERLVLSLRATAGLEAWLQGSTERIPMEETRPPGRYVASLHAEELYRVGCTADLCDLRDELVPLELTFGVADGVDTAKLEVEYPLRLLDTTRLPVVELRDPPDDVNGVDRMVVGRPLPFGTYRWRFPDGTLGSVDSRVDDRLRLRLAPGLHAWVSAEDAGFLPLESPRPAAVVGDLRFETRGDRVVLRLPLAAALPLQIEEPDSHSLEVTLFGATGNTNRVAHGAGSRVIQSVRWSQLPGERYRVTIRLTEPLWGHRASYRRLPADRVELLLEIHRVPAIDPARPLRGRRIAIDPGHPGAGAHGPTGYYEGDANLAIGRLLEQSLRQAGAEPILIRADTLPMGLYERTTAAQEAGAELFVSIHNNALPDGVRPFGREGTSTYYYHPHSAGLAAAVQDGMLGSMRLRDLGVYWGDLAVCRMAWMPAILTEGAFMMMPSHEAALKTSEFQERYARGVQSGIESFLRGMAVRRAGDARWQ